MTIGIGPASAARRTRQLLGRLAALYPCVILSGRTHADLMGKLRSLSFHACRLQAKPAANDGRDTCADLHRGTFAAESDSAGQANGRKPKLTQHRAEADEADTDKQSGLRLRNAATPGIREIKREQNPDDERSERGDDHSPPDRAPRRVEPAPQILGKQNKADNNKPTTAPITR